MKLSIAIFAYNESDNIGCFLRDLFAQDIFRATSENKPGVYLLANGCSDDTVEKAQAFKGTLSDGLSELLNIVDLPQGGKSRTWNTFVHSLCPSESEYILFCDGDIRIPKVDVVTNMLNIFRDDPELLVINSWPRKDTDLDPRPLGGMAKLITAAGGSLTNYKTAICGQLYMVKTAPVKDIYMPIGLPVEDGFLKAMLLTKLFSEPENMKGITGSEKVWHSYESITSLSELINHQVRIVIGSAINLMLFDVITQVKGDYSAAAKLLEEGGKNEKWLSEYIDKELPKMPHGYVPFHFIFKRIQALIAQKKYTPKNIVVGMVGFVFDVLVYAIASYKMFRGAGSGHW